MAIVLAEDINGTAAANPAPGTLISQTSCLTVLIKATVEWEQMCQF